MADCYTGFTPYHNENCDVCSERCFGTKYDCNDCSACICEECVCSNGHDESHILKRTLCELDKQADYIHGPYVVCVRCKSSRFPGVLYVCTVCNDTMFCDQCKEKSSCHENEHKMQDLQPKPVLTNDYCFARAIKLQNYVGRFLSKRTWDKFDCKTDEGKRQLDRKIGFAFYGAPSLDPEKTEKCIYGYTEEQEEAILEMRNKLIEKDFVHYKEKQIWVNFVFVSFFKIKEFEGTLVLIKMVSKGCSLFIEPSGRTYTGFDDFLNKNKLPECKLLYPKNGTYEIGHNKQIKTAWRQSADCDQSRKLAKAADTSVGIVGLGASILGGVLCFTPAAPLGVAILTGTAIVTTPYTTARAVYNIYDRGSHDESINPFGSREAFFNWLSLVGAGASLGALGCTAYLNSAALASAEISTTTRVLMNSAIFGNLGIQGVGLVAGATNIIMKIKNDEEVTSLEWLQFSASIFFFTSAVVNVKTAGDIIKSAQQQKFNEVREMLPVDERENFDNMLQKDIKESGSQMRGGRESMKKINEMAKNGDLSFKDEVAPIDQSSTAQKHSNKIGHNNLYKQDGKYINVPTEKAAVETAAEAVKTRYNGVWKINKQTNQPKPQTTTVFGETAAQLDARVAKNIEAGNVQTNGQGQLVVTLKGETHATVVQSGIGSWAIQACSHLLRSELSPKSRQMSGVRGLSFGMNMVQRNQPYANFLMTKTGNVINHKVDGNVRITDARVVLDSNGKATHLMSNEPGNVATFDPKNPGVEIVRPTGTGAENELVYINCGYIAKKNERERDLWDFDWLENEE